MLFPNHDKKVVVVNLHQVVQVVSELELKAYYAGHVLGAAMFQVKVGNQSVVYTGDYNMTPDRHLGAAWIDLCRPDLLITESTFATTVRDRFTTASTGAARSSSPCSPWVKPRSSASSSRPTGRG